MDRLRESALRAIETKVFPGCVIGVVENGDTDVRAFGRMTYADDSTEVQGDTLYDVASITKSIPTAALAIQLLDEGKLRLSDHLIECVPEYRARYAEAVTIEHLLTYTVDGPAISTLTQRSAEEILAAVFMHESRFQPGEKFAYTNVPALLVGLVVEKILAMPLDRAAHERIFDPLKMHDTSFAPPVERTAPTEINERGEVRGVVHDESAYIFSKVGRTMGHAGLFSTVPDLLAYMRHFLAGDTSRALRNYIPHLHASVSLGWELNQPFMGGNARFGKTGFTGTSIVSDGKKAVVILSNRTYPKRPPDASAVTAFRAEISDIVFG